VNFEEAHRLGAELELVARSSLQTLLEHMSGAVDPLRNSVENGYHTLWLELAPSETSIDDAVSRYAAVFDALPPDQRGLQAGLRPHAFSLLASGNAIAELARLRLRLQITLYAATTTLRRRSTQVPTLRPNPSVKGTSRKRAAPYVER
jgi:hypothetical protein